MENGITFVLRWKMLHECIEGMILEGFHIWMYTWVWSRRLRLMLCVIESAFLLAGCVSHPPCVRVCVCLYQAAHISSTVSVFGSGYRTVCSSEWLSYKCACVCACAYKCVVWERASRGWLTVTSRAVSLGGAATREGSSPLHIWPCCYQSGLERRREWAERLTGELEKRQQMGGGYCWTGHVFWVKGYRKRFIEATRKDNWLVVMWFILNLWNELHIFSGSTGCGKFENCCI